MDNNIFKLQNEYKKSWQKFISGEEVDSLPNPLILDSWRRSKIHNIDPMQKSAKEIINDDELYKLREKNSHLLSISMPMLESVYEYCKNSGFTVVLSDSNGYLIEVFGDENVQNLGQSGKWIAGANWSEKSAGTNVIGMSLTTKQPISLTGYECYCHYSHKWSGAGAPIKGPDGNIVGAIGLAGLIDDYNPHTLGLVIAASRAIEIQLSMKIAWDECALSEQQKSTIVDTIGEGILVIDVNGKITLSNRKVHKILHTTEEQLLNTSIDKIFSENLVDMLENEKIRVVDVQDEISFDNHKVKCFITSKPIIIENNKNGEIIILNEIEHTKKLADKILNKSAGKTLDDIIGFNRAISETKEMVKSVAPMKINIMLLGESGTGKDIFAQAIHNASNCRLGPFIAINCGAIPKELIISELFGYSDGAFTGASRGGKPGKFEMADKGTLFLDEIGEMPLEQQKIFLRVLEENKITRLGGQVDIPADVRIITATNKDLEQEIALGNFRRDLFYRLNGFTLNLIPLRERKDDLKPLCEIFIEDICKELGLEKPEMTEDAWDALYNYDWPGNIRELQNALRRAVILSRNQKFSSAEFSFLKPEKHIDPGSSPVSVKDAVNQYEADLLKNLLEKNNWNIAKTSTDLGVSRVTLYRKMKLFGIDASD